MICTVKLHRMDLAAFTAMLNDCQGPVYLVTPDGNRLDLKSRLCQLLAFTSLVKGDSLPGATLLCENAADQAALLRADLVGGGAASL